ncbi:MAG: hypothetical protein VXZ29_01465, partial [Pseudomonadota bacterium]|nr:hypothetical protein [Pseudomonadota bacterium]
SLHYEVVADSQLVVKSVRSRHYARLTERDHTMRYNAPPLRPLRGPLVGKPRTSAPISTAAVANAVR